MQRVFVGSLALAGGALTRHQLRHYHRRLLPDVYASKAINLTLADRGYAAWLWSHRRGVICGLAASALLGARWVDDDIPIEIALPHNRSPAGIITRRDRIATAEVQRVNEIAVTNPARTALDLARRLPVREAVARVDALARATGVGPEDVRAVASSHPNLPGLRRVPAVLDLLDAGAESPRETWLRLLLIEEGFPRPRTQIPIPGPDGQVRYYLDMGWEEEQIAAEYDGEQHRTDTTQYRNDISRHEYLRSLGWTVVRVVAGNPRAEIVRRVRAAWDARRHAG